MATDDFVAAGNTWRSFQHDLTELQQSVPVPSIVIAAMLFGREGVFGGEVIQLPGLTSGPADRIPRLEFEACLLAFLQQKCDQIQRMAANEYGPELNEAFARHAKGYSDHGRFNRSRRSPPRRG
jgi:hypothetical protein